LGLVVVAAIVGLVIPAAAGVVGSVFHCLAEIKVRKGVK